MSPIMNEYLQPASGNRDLEVGSDPLDKIKYPPRGDRVLVGHPRGPITVAPGQTLTLEIPIVIHVGGIQETVSFQIDRRHTYEELSAVRDIVGDGGDLYRYLVKAAVCNWLEGTGLRPKDED